MLKYLFLPDDHPVLIPPSFQAYKCIILIERNIRADYQAAVSKLIVESGCQWSFSWGRDCVSWDDSVDCANIDQFTGAQIPEDKLVVTTWHDRDTLEEVFEFSKQCTDYEGLPIKDTLVLDFGPLNRQKYIESLFQ